MNRSTEQQAQKLVLEGYRRIYSKIAIYLAFFLNAARSSRIKQLAKERKKETNEKNTFESRSFTFG